MDEIPQQAEVVPTVVEAAPVEKKPETIGEVIGDKPEDKPANVVPEAALLSEKKGRKAAEKRVKELEALIQSGATAEDVSEDIEAIADEHNIDKAFLKKFATAVRKDAEKDFEERIDKKLKPLEAKDREERIEKVFSKHFDAALSDMPEFANVVNRDVIKSLSLDPKNANKTFAQLIEETYGKAVPGKRTIETTTPALDLDRVRIDEKYLDEVLSDPLLKKQYQDAIVENIRF